ncbi:MAG: hypothetical protein Q8865_04855 [Bacillota bacterium]|nr:hypothetical protein [Bacillota bacterium]
MNKLTGIVSSSAVTAATALFALGILLSDQNLSYFVCILLSWGFILLVCSFASEVCFENKALAYGGIAFSCIYGVFVTLVYFIQLTTVANGTASPEILKFLSYTTLGSPMFNLDLLGYGMMAVSTFLIAFSLHIKCAADQWLKALLMIHGIFVFPCVLSPMLNIFSMNMKNGDRIGRIALLLWCLYFIPIGILSTFHFVRKQHN